ncbi:MAG: prepilin peptidase, partial [Terriglobales bacterium]
MESWNATVLGITLVAALWDLRTRTIPRWLTLPALGAGLVWHAAAGGFFSALAAAGLGLGLGLLLLSLGAFGGGDAKWLAALGALLGIHAWLWSLGFGLIAAGAWALWQLARRSRLVFLPQD